VQTCSFARSGHIPANLGGSRRTSLHESGEAVRPVQNPSPSILPQKMPEQRPALGCKLQEKRYCFPCGRLIPGNLIPGAKSMHGSHADSGDIGIWSSGWTPERCRSEFIWGGGDLKSKKARYEKLAEISRGFRCYNRLHRRSVMAKSRDARKDAKKKPAKSIKEKRKAKLERKLK